MYTHVRFSEKTAKPDATVCLVFNDRKLDTHDSDSDARSGKLLSAALKRADFKAGAGETLALASGGGESFVLLGLGDPEKLDAEKVRMAGAGLVKALEKLEVAIAEIRVHGNAFLSVENFTFGRALGEGIALGGYRFEDFKKNGSNAGKKLTLSVSTNDKACAGGIRKGFGVAESVNYTRRLQATPPNVATTDYIAARARDLARECKLKCSVIRGAELERKNLVGLYNVGKASENKPCLIQLSYTPRGKSKGTVVLVGKTICFDTGGLTLKPRESMHGMKYDKSGGMAVLGAMRAVSRIKPGCRVIGLLPAAENSISDEAYRVDDILRYPNGVSVEITNTDAEGRLVLADALIYACKNLKPDAIIDLATLTGGVVVALGRTYAGYFCEDVELRERLERAAADSGDRLWRLPTHEDYCEMMKSKHADIWNSAPVREAHPIQGAAFLSYFVDENIPWAHIDIAGTADFEKEHKMYGVGPTGYGVRLLASVLENW